VGGLENTIPKKQRKKYLNQRKENTFQKNIKEKYLSHTKKKPFSEETKQKIRLSAIKRIEKCKFNGTRMVPSYNPKSIPIIEEFGKANGYNFQHAENGGEFYIKTLGY